MNKQNKNDKKIEEQKCFKLKKDKKMHFKIRQKLAEHKMKNVYYFINQTKKMN